MLSNHSGLLLPELYKGVIAVQEILGAEITCPKPSRGLGGFLLPLKGLLRVNLEGILVYGSCLVCFLVL